MIDSIKRRRKSDFDQAQRGCVPKPKIAPEPSLPSGQPLRQAARVKWDHAVHAGEEDYSGREVEAQRGGAPEHRPPSFGPNAERGGRGAPLEHEEDGLITLHPAKHDPEYILVHERGDRERQERRANGCAESIRRFKNVFVEELLGGTVVAPPKVSGRPRQQRGVHELAPPSATQPPERPGDRRAGKERQAERENFGAVLRRKRKAAPIDAEQGHEDDGPGGEARQASRQAGKVHRAAWARFRVQLPQYDRENIGQERGERPEVWSQPAASADRQIVT